MRKGMSLTEVVIAMALVALSVGGIMAVLVQSVGLRESIDNAYAAVGLAKNRIERIRELRRDRGYTALAEAVESDTVIDRNGAYDLNGDFKRTTIVNTGYAANLTKVTVKVKYKRRNVFIPESMEAVTLISPYKESD